MTEELITGGFLENFHFIRPWWLLGLVPAIVLFALLWRIDSIASAWDKAIDRELLPYLLDRSKNAAQKTPLLLLISAWTLAIVALAGPSWEQLPQPVQKRQDALVILLDLSLSMFATDLEPNRMTAARRKLMDILDERDEGQTALVVYAGDAHTVTPLTDDSVTITAMVPALSPNIMPVFGSNPGAAVERAQQLLTDSGTLNARILLMTDGVSPDDAATLRRLLADSRYQFSIMGIGTEEGAPIPAAQGDFLRDDNGQVVVPVLDSDSLRSLAADLDARYREIELSRGDISYLLAEGLLPDENISAVDENFDVWYDAGPWLLLLLLPIGALIFRRGWLLTLTMTTGATAALLMPATPAQAAEWQDLWKTGDQQGAEMLEQDPAAAAALFDSDEWKAVANYRAEDFEAAVELFADRASAEDAGADDHYNLGNSLAWAGQYEPALQAYDAALSLDAAHEDAVHNREIVEQLLEQQEQEQETDDESEDEQEQQEQEQAENQQSQDQQQQEQGEQEQESEEEPSEEEESSEEQESETQNEQQATAVAESEDQQSLEQWLRRIEDDPGELLQRKFQYQYRRRQLQGGSAGQPADGQIW